MTRLARWCFDHRRRVLVAWLLAAVALLGLSRAAGSTFNAALSLPNTDSQAAVSLLTQNFPAAAGAGDQVVIQATSGATIASPSVRAAVTTALDRVAQLPGIQSVASPYAPGGAAQVSRDGTIAFARVTWNTQPASITTTAAGRSSRPPNRPTAPTPTSPSRARRSPTPNARPWARRSPSGSSPR